jgi:preprotein translocase subunit SecB
VRDHGRDRQQWWKSRRGDHTHSAARHPCAGTVYQGPFVRESERAALAAAKRTAPKLDVNVNVNARPQSESEFEIELKLEAKATRGKDTLFLAEVNYAGLFQIRNVPQEHMHPLLLIECPRLLFPFARQIIADATRQGGFPPLMIDPVDFAALYRQRMSELTVQQKAALRQS